MHEVEANGGPFRPGSPHFKSLNIMGDWKLWTNSHAIEIMHDNYHCAAVRVAGVP
jgi:hypothetical protein